MLAGTSDGVGDGLQRPLQADLGTGEAKLMPPRKHMLHGTEGTR